MRSIPRLPLGAVTAAALTFAAMLLTFASTLVLRAAAGLSDDVVVLGVALTVTFARVPTSHNAVERAVRVIAVPAVSVLAFGVGSLLGRQPVLGAVLYVIVLSGAVWLRRFGARARRIGTLLSLPFVAVLITPLPALPAGGGGEGGTEPLWFAAVALIAVAWSTLAQVVAERRAPSSRTVIPVAIGPSTASARPEPQRSTKRLMPSSRMAVQYALALSAAFLVGHLVFGEHWPWVVITAYLAMSGNRGRGDVVYKGVMRVLGALGGTVIATGIALLLPAGDPIAVVGVFVALALGLLLRPLNYAFWAAAITAALGLLYGYFGIGGETLLLGRIGGVLVGGVIAVASAWFVLPIRTTDVLRRRMFDALAALSDVLGALRTDPARVPAEAAAFRRSVAELEHLLPTLAAADVVLRLRRAEPRHGHLVRALRSCVDPVDRLAALPPESLADPSSRSNAALLARRLGALRRALANRSQPDLGHPIDFGESPADAALRAIDRVISDWR